MGIADRHHFARFLLSPFLVLAIGAGEIRGQPQPASGPAFEVASVKPTGRPPESSGSGWTVSHGSFTAHSAWVRGMIAMAHGVHAAQVHGGPAWVDTEAYDVVAKAGSPDAGLDQIKAMLRTLLADRFRLVAHHETKEGPIYTLVVGKSGPKMQEAKDNEKTYISDAGRGRLVGTRITMPALVIILTNMLGTPVVDKTGLTGYYDFSLAWTDPLSQKPGAGNSQAIDTPPDLFGAVEDQLGLGLEATKGPVDILVIDHIEKPSGN